MDSLAQHPHIVSFDKIIVDELEGRCVGFTTEYIPGGTLEENKSRTFKLKWLSQLITVIDELNLNLGIAHQDVAPRNLLINEATDSIMIFDFNFSIRSEEPSYSEARNDIKGVFSPSMRSSLATKHCVPFGTRNNTSWK
jgi:serine/threonine protein kinase